MKKKLLVTSLVIALIAIAVGGTLAYFMDSDKATNTFTIGSVEIVQHEQQRVDQTKDFTEAGNLEIFENDKQMIPVISNETPTDDPNFQDKYVTVENIGKNDAYVQTFVAVPESLVDANVLHIKAGSGWASPVDVGTVAESAIVEGSTSTVEYAIYKYVYNSKLAKETTTTPAIEGVYISAAADMDVTFDAEGNATSAQFMMNGTAVTGFDATQKINVYVVSQAIQADGFADANTALANFGSHPWVTE